MAKAGQLEPLPSGVYSGTMSSADIYPTHRGIGGVRTQDRALPAYGEATVQAAQRSIMVGQLDKGLLGTPAGWLVLILIGLVAGAWLIK